MKIRTVTPQDTEALTQLLNDVIGAGGTTAIETPLTPAEFSEWFISGSNALSCQVAEVDGLLVGFQALSADDALPPDTADIATFSRLSPEGTWRRRCVVPCHISGGEVSRFQAHQRHHSGG